MLALLLACGHPADTADTASSCGDDTVSWQSFGHGFFLTYCNACHSQDSETRHGAPPGVDFDTLEQAKSQSERIRVRVLDQQDMPLGGGVSEADLLLLDAWLCTVEAQ